VTLSSRSSARADAQKRRSPFPRRFWRKAACPHPADSVGQDPDADHPLPVVGSTTNPARQSGGSVAKL